MMASYATPSQHFQQSPYSDHPDALPPHPQAPYASPYGAYGTDSQLTEYRDDPVYPPAGASPNKSALRLTGDNVPLARSLVPGAASGGRTKTWTPPFNESWEWAADRICAADLGGQFVLELRTCFSSILSFDFQFLPPLSLVLHPLFILRLSSVRSSIRAPSFLLSSSSLIPFHLSFYALHFALFLGIAGPPGPPLPAAALVADASTERRSHIVFLPGGAWRRERGNAGGVASPFIHSAVRGASVPGTEVDAQPPSSDADLLFSEARGNGAQLQVRCRGDRTGLLQAIRVLVNAASEYGGASEAAGAAGAVPLSGFSRRPRASASYARAFRCPVRVSVERSVDVQNAADSDSRRWVERHGLGCYGRGFAGVVRGVLLGWSELNLEHRILNCFVVTESRTVQYVFYASPRGIFIPWVGIARRTSNANEIKSVGMSSASYNM
ncbi:hypothetical protein B0H17DRAFT_1237504 [Mycena rosella]|uniref:Uncharacterized protein n=1 Tax=Mycena rosella TaxID=1033263 RepID=A0AAD7GQA0_MYCRO|nr:hypothetical protein B0H17DRAFT_1237504 [Mycena rosella]